MSGVWRLLFREYVSMQEIGIIVACFIVLVIIGIVGTLISMREADEDNKEWK